MQLDQINAILQRGSAEQAEEAQPVTPEPETAEAEAVEAVETTEVEQEEQPAIEIDGLQGYLDARGPEELYEYELSITGLGEDPEKITVGKLKDSYQDYVRDRERLAKDREAFESRAKEALQKLEEVKAPPREEIVQLTAQKALLEQQFGLIDQNQQLDPGEKANLKLQYQQAWQQADAQLKQVQQQADEALSKRQQELVNLRNQQLYANIKDWTSQDAVASDMNVMGQYAAKFGYKPDELAGMLDHRGLELIRHAALMWREKEATKEVTKKVKKAPVSVRARPKVKTQAKDRQKLIDAGKKAKSGTDKAAIINQLLQNRG